MKTNSLYLLFLYIPLLYVFYILMTWATCVPIAEIGPYLSLSSDGQVPDNATCFLDNHMSQLSFYSYPPLRENIAYYLSLLVVGVFLLLILIKPMIRFLLIIKTKASEK